MTVEGFEGFDGCNGVKGFDGFKGFKRFEGFKGFDGHDAVSLAVCIVVIFWTTKCTATRGIGGCVERAVE